MPNSSRPRTGTPAALCAIEVAMVVTDVGFVAYWLATGLGLIPPEVAYSDYTDPRVVAWNWSFLPIDLAVSATGLTSLWLLRRRSPGWPWLMVVSLTLTSATGLMAVSYWAVRAEFDPAWWTPNLFLLLYPLPAIVWLVRARTVAAPPQPALGCRSAMESALNRSQPS